MMERDIYCKNGRCPICNSQMIDISKNFHYSLHPSFGKLYRFKRKDRFAWMKCSNNCYEIRTKVGRYHSGAFYLYNYFWIFDKSEFIFHNRSSKRKKRIFKEKLKFAICFYRKDYRYVEEILEMS